MSPETNETNLSPVACPRCGETMRSATVRTAIWRDESLFVVEDIPAQVCDSCMEQFYDEETSDALRRLTEEGFSSLRPKKEVLVPIFSLQGQIVRRAPSAEDGAFTERY
ncbi:MAG: YgiT-type zinc finger protein [Acidobacteria bacterium]|nr:YgiT-type zinc finger protein [Acidobacteriota bacterium]MBI3473592.1 YgiT-type zinc finger protein [Candidatus Solibacter usitatus]